jgi:uncharacterized protein YbjT (DUF2867 family)
VQKASGFVGSAVLDALVDSGHFKVTVLTRGKPNNVATSDVSSIQYRTVNYESLDALTEALRGQDAVVSTIGKADSTKVQHNLVDAAVAAGVKHFIPSEFGADLKNPNVAAFPIYQAKVALESYLEEKAAQSGLAYTYIYNNVIFEFGLRVGAILDLKNRSVPLYDGGSHLFTSARLSSIGHAVVQILVRPHDFANKSVRIGDIAISQQRLFEIAQRLTPGEEWAVAQVDTARLVENVQEELAARKFSIRLFNAYAIRGAFGLNFDGFYKNNDNETLGIQQTSEAELGKYLAGYLQ